MPKPWRPPEMNLNTVQKIGVWALVLVASDAVFALYTRPEFLFTLANQVWACF